MDLNSFFDKKQYEDILFRIGYFRNKNNLSARETSIQLGYSDSFINRIERNNIELKVSTLLSFMNLLDITPMEFFYPKPENFKTDISLINKVLSLSVDNKKLIAELIDKMK